MARQNKARKGATEMPKIDESYIRNYTDGRSFDKGRRYFNNGAISDARKSGSTIKAFCAGSQPYPYKVSAALGKDGIKGASCSCPVGSSDCKHVVAMLLQWLHLPGSFRETEDIGASLGKRSKEELIALVKQMVASFPELEPLAELPATAKGHSQDPSEKFRLQAAEAFRHARGGWGITARIAASLDFILERGNDSLERGDIHGAFAAFSSVEAEVLENEEMFNEDDGDLGIVVQNCVKGLGKCLAKSANDIALRKKILKALFDVYRFDVDYGGIDLGNEVPGIVRKHATVDERTEVAGWIRAAVPLDKNEASDWQLKEYKDFLTKLEKSAR